MTPSLLEESKKSPGRVLHLPLSVQVDVILALFGLTNKDLNCVNKGEPAETVQRRVQLCGQFVNLLMRDSGIFDSGIDALIFLKWLASAIPVALSDQLIPPGGEITRSAENLDFCSKLVRLLGEVMKVATDQDRIAYTNLNRDEKARRTDTLVYLNSIRPGRSFHISLGLTELSTYMSREEFNRKSKNIVQEDSRPGSQSLRSVIPLRCIQPLHHLQKAFDVHRGGDHCWRKASHQKARQHH